MADPPALSHTATAFLNHIESPRWTGSVVVRTATLVLRALVSFKNYYSAWMHRRIAVDLGVG